MSETYTNIMAFDRLRDYEQRSLAHEAGSPLMMGMGWRGLGWRIGERRLVTPYDQVLEVLSVPAITPVPGTQGWLLGLANVRGNLLPVIDLKLFLENQRSAALEHQRMLLVRQTGGDVGILIDELLGQRMFDESAASPINEAEAHHGRYAPFIDRVYRQDEDEWLVFDLDRLTQTTEFRQAAA